MIILEKVGFSYSRKGPRVIEGMDLAIAQNEIVALVGPNGCGKTTVGKLMTGILKPQAGSAWVNGMDTRTTVLSTLGQHIGYLFQDPERQLFAPTVREELSFVFDLTGRKPDDYQEQVDGMLERFHLAALADELPFQLSRGEKQRLAMAAVMIQDPTFYIFDEPTTGLDELRRRELSKMLLDMAAAGKGMLLISHDQPFVQRQAQRIIRMEGGKVIADERIS